MSCATLLPDVGAVTLTVSRLSMSAFLTALLMVTERIGLTSFTNPDPTGLAEWLAVLVLALLLFSLSLAFSQEAFSRRAVRFDAARGVFVFP